MDKTNFWVKAAPLLLVIFIDGMGVGLVVPVLNALIFSSSSHFFSHAISPVMHNIIYGVTIGLFMFCWFFGAALLGDLSDKIGRKKALIICLLGASLSYLVSAFAVIWHSLILLLLGRVIGGLTSGSQPIAQAAIVDLSTEQDKARNIGYILMALSFGFILGPLFGGILADKQLVSWFNYALPFYFAATISLINTALLWFLFKETAPTPRKFSVRIYQAVDIFISAFKHEKVKRLSAIFAIFIFGWSSFYSYVPLFLLKTFQFSTTQISCFLALESVGFAIGNGVLVHFFTKRFSLKNNFIYSGLFGAILVICMISLHNALICWILMAPVAICVALAYSALLTLFSDQVDASSQGWIMGITGSIMAFMWGVNSIVAGFLATWNVILPIVITAVCFTIAVFYSLTSNSR